MHRVFIPSAGTSRTLKIENEHARHLILVLRCRKGEEIIVFDGNASHRAVITEISKKTVMAEIVETLARDAESPLNSVIVQGLLKGEKMDIVIQKTTELGIKEIMPVITERSQVRETRKALRWRKIAEEASRQCGRTSVPLVREPMPFHELLASPLFSSKPLPAGIIFWEEGGLTLKEAARKFASPGISHFHDCRLFALIGPEGGFTQKEVDAAKSKGIIAASLGPRMLRAETAAIAAAALLQHIYGDMG